MQELLHLGKSMWSLLIQSSSVAEQMTRLAQSKKEKRNSSIIIAMHYYT